MRKVLLIISLSILPLTSFGASGNCEWLPYSTMGTAAGGAAASSNGGLLLSTASSSSTSGGLFCDWVNVDEKEKVKFIVYNNDVLIEDISKGNKVRIVGFGAFEVRRRAARIGRNPRTGEQIQIAASQKVKFLPAKALKEVFNK